MSEDGTGRKMKTAYEIALERLDEQGVSPPSSETLSSETKSAMAQVRAKARASIAELEILHRDRLNKSTDPAERTEEQRSFLDERRRIEERCSAEIDRLRSSQ